MWSFLSAGIKYVGNLMKTGWVAVLTATKSMCSRVGQMFCVLGSVLLRLVARILSLITLPFAWVWSCIGTKDRATDIRTSNSRLDNEGSNTTTELSEEKQTDQSPDRQTDRQTATVISPETSDTVSVDSDVSTISHRI